MLRHLVRSTKSRFPLPLRAHLLLLATLPALVSCVTVKPQQRAILADPIMQFEGDPHAHAPIRHALDNREGSFGGDGVSGGGCGCN